MISREEFAKVELRVGTIIRAEEFPAARKPAYRLWTELGVKKSNAQIRALYRREDLVGRQVADFISECLTAGFVAGKGDMRSPSGK